MLLDVALEVHFHTLRQEALAASGAAAAQDVTAIGGLHAGAETELLFPGALGGLVGPEGLGHGVLGWLKSSPEGDE